MPFKAKIENQNIPLHLFISNACAVGFDRLSSMGLPVCSGLTSVKPIYNHLRGLNVLRCRRNKVFSTVINSFWWLI
jgi:hypothetical protein